MVILVAHYSHPGQGVWLKAEPGGLVLGLASGPGQKQGSPQGLTSQGRRMVPLEWFPRAGRGAPDTKTCERGCELLRLAIAALAFVAFFDGDQSRRTTSDQPEGMVAGDFCQLSGAMLAVIR